MIVIDFLLIVIVSYCFLILIKYILWAIRAANMTANIPGPKPWPIIGNAALFAKVKTGEDFYKILDNIYQEHTTPTNKMVKIWLGPKLVIGLGDSKHIEAILSSPDALSKDIVYNIFGLIGNGLFVRNGQEWRDLRKPLDKLLTKKMIESNLEMFHEKAMKVCKVINKYAVNGQSFNFRHYATNFSADTVTVSNFGYDLNELEKEQYKLLEVFDKLEEHTVKMLVHVPNHFSSLYLNFSASGRRVKDLARSYWNLSNKILQKRIGDRKKQGEEIDEKPVFYSDVLIQKAKQKALSLEDTGRLATDFLIAGFDTSAVTISYIMLMLAMYPEHQEAVYQEQVDILGEDPEVAPTWEQLSKMKYLIKVIKEVMRLFCPLAILRKLTKDVELGEYKLPKGCSALVAFYSLHRDPDLWSHPHEFYPDHFSPEEISARPKGAYFPFSWGPRSCPGSVYAMATNKIVVSTVVRKYILETDLTFDKLEYKFSLLLEVSQGYMISIKPRN
ncbi:cytochrome P450 4C1-like [Rhodnius prolixus]